MLPLVVTRFSLQGFGRPVPSPAWIDDRFDLLERVGVPGLRDSGAVWCLLGHPNTLEQVQGRVDALEVPGVSVHVVPAVGAEVNTGDGVTPPPDLPLDDEVVTFRLDSDDAYLPGTLERVATAAADLPAGTIINLPDGYQFTSADGRLRRFSIPLSHQGPFLAVRRSRADAFDVGGDHRRARGSGPVVHLRGRAWVQFVHGDNVLNDTISWRPRQLRHLPDLRVSTSGSPVVGPPMRSVMRPF